MKYLFGYEFLGLSIVYHIMKLDAEVFLFKQFSLKQGLTKGSDLK